jgi:hypothetical protein
MNTNEALISRFYNSFQNRNYSGMQSCYSDNAVFSDPVFPNLNASETKAMWEMLCKRGKDLHLDFSGVEANNSTGSANWTAYYTFSGTGKKVTNHVKASFRFENGLIVEHIDDFNFYEWASQALGLPGKLLGWTGWMKNKVRTSARNSLISFINRSETSPGTS